MSDVGVVEVPGLVTSTMEFRYAPVPPATDGALGDPDVVTVTVQDPAGGSTVHVYGVSVALTRVSAGVYALNVAVTTAGRWALRWVSSGGGPIVSAETEFWVSGALGPGPIASAALPVSWRPSVTDVAAVVPTRTGVVGDSGVEYRDSFDDDTRPTGVQVEGIVAEIMGEVIAAVGDMPARLATPSMPTGGPGSSPAGHCVVLGAASLVELRFFPDMQQLGAASPASVLWQRYKDALARLVSAAADLGDGTDTLGASGSPSYRFPKLLSGAPAHDTESAVVADSAYVTRWNERW